MSSPTTLPVATAPAGPPPLNLPHVKLDFFAGFLSYLLPGMGQISQGRVSKGIVFFVSLHALFFYGMYLGSWQNVWLPKKERAGNFFSKTIPDILDRPHFAGQFFIGMSAWPAVYQYLYYEEPQRVIRMKNFQRAPSSEEINNLQRNNNKTWDLGWVYTVIAGVLNLLVIYDAIAGPAFREVPNPAPEKKPEEPTKP
jgi:hypothetical protein